MESEADFADVASSLVPMLHHTAWLLTADSHAAEDLVQETLARLYVAMSKRRGVDNPAGYARTVLVRLHIDRRRRRASSEVVTDRVPEVPVEFDPTDALVVEAALGQLRPEDRVVIVLRYYVGLSVAETARDLHTSPGAVRMRASRALARLRSLLGEVTVPDAADDAVTARPT